MNRIGKLTRILVWTGLFGGCIFLESAWAAESGLFTRHAFDLIMRWINFLILAGVAIKYGRRPILNFLDTQKKKVLQSIDELEKQKIQTQALVEESQHQLIDNQERLGRIKERIIAEGKNRKEQLISEAQNDARNMMGSAKEKIDSQLKAAHANLIDEVVDTATELAITKLPAIITMEDQEQWIHTWFEATAKTQ